MHKNAIALPGQLRRAGMIAVLACCTLPGCGLSGAPASANGGAATPANNGATDGVAGGTATLTWTASADDPVPVAAFRVYTGRTMDSLEFYRSLAAPATRLVVTGLTAGQWFFAVTSVSDAGVESAFSAVANKMIQ